MIEVRDMTPADEAFVGCCTHVDQNPEWSAAATVRLPWLRETHAQGLRVKVALVEGRHAGFLYCMPIELAPWGPTGQDLLVISCLTVPEQARGQGVGRRLVAAAEAAARHQELKGVAVLAYYHDFWFMPAPFFAACGYAVARRAGEAAVLWKTWGSPVTAPEFLERRYRYEPEPGKVAVDLFWTRACLTSVTEAERVKEVCAEFGDAVCLREFCTDVPVVRDSAGLCRAIFVNGREIGWGYEAPRDGVREAIAAALA